jgi:hypothetical protein
MIIFYADRIEKNMSKFTGTGNPANTNEFGRRAEAAGGAGAAVVAPARRPEPAVRLPGQPQQNLRQLRQLSLLNATRKLRNAENVLTRNPTNRESQIGRNLARNLVSRIENSTNAELAQAATGVLPPRFAARAPRKRRNTRRKNNRK